MELTHEDQLRGPRALTFGMIAGIACWALIALASLGGKTQPA